jgi:hypothetical protein
LTANEFIRVINAEFDKDFDEVDVAAIAFQDPYLDNDGDGCIEGPGFLTVPGVTGDLNDANPAVRGCGQLPAKSGAAVRLPWHSPLAPGGWSLPGR